MIDKERNIVRDLVRKYYKALTELNELDEKIFNEGSGHRDDSLIKKRFEKLNEWQQISNDLYGLLAKLAKDEKK